MIKVIFLTVFSIGSPSSPFDSLRLEVIKGQKFIIHQIDEKETLYSISRRYGVTITSILENNPTADGGLSVGNELKVPYVPFKPKVTKQTSEGTLHKVAAGETLFSISRQYKVTVDEIKTWNNIKDNSLSPGQEILIKNKAVEFVKVPEAKSVKGTHTVGQKETLYSISRQYGVTVQQLKDWNGITNEELKIGQTLFVVQPMYSNQGTLTNGKQESEIKVVKKEEPVRQEVNIPTEQKEVIKISEKVIGTDEVREGGLAELIEGTEGNRKYLALHRSAKIGSILKIKNELNNREVFVRVVGALPDTGVNDKLVIKISKSAYDRLGAIDQRFRVEVTYYK